MADAMRNAPRLFLVLLVIGFVGVVFAGEARAEGEWTIEEFGLEQEGLSSAAVKTTATTAFTLESKVLGSSFGMSCTGLSATGSIRVGGTASEELGLTGCTVSKPSGCAVPSSISFPVKSELVYKSEALYEKFVPSEGTIFVTLKITGCAAAGSYQLKGGFGAAVEQFGVQKTEQPLTVTAAATTATGSSLTLGKEAAVLQGAAKRQLQAPNFGKNFGPSPIRPKVPLFFGKVVFPNNKVIEEKIGIAANVKVKFAEIQVVGGAGVYTKEADGCSGVEKGGGGAEVECTVKFKFTAPNMAGEKFLGQAVIGWEVMPKGSPSGVARGVMAAET
jgi:hypothetical protein